MIPVSSYNFIFQFFWYRKNRRIKITNSEIVDLFTCLIFSRISPPSFTISEPINVSDKCDNFMPWFFAANVKGMMEITRTIR
jgi:hypothetical protein